MTRLKGIFLLLVIIVTNSIAVHAQLYAKLTKECYKMYQVFTDTGYLSFTIKYLYSTEKQPAVFTDSLSASMKVHGKNYYGAFRNVAYLQDSNYMVTIYSANNSVVVSNPAVRNKSVMPVANFDSAFLAKDIDSAWITEDATTRSIKFRFRPTSVFKAYTINYDKNNYRLQKITYSLRQHYINPGDTAFMAPNPLVTVCFSGYSNTNFSDDVFDHTRYITKDTSGQFRGVGDYSNYQIMSTYRQPAPPTGMHVSRFLEHDEYAKTDDRRLFHVKALAIQNKLSVLGNCNNFYSCSEILFFRQDDLTVS